MAARAKALTARTGAPVVFSVVAGGQYDPLTNVETGAVTMTVSGSAVRIAGDPLKYQALELIPSEAPTLLFTPDVYGEVPALGSTVTFGGLQYIVRDVDVVAPDGRAMGATVVVAGGGPGPMVGRVALVLAPLALSATGSFRANLASLRAGVTDSVLIGAWTLPRVSSAGTVATVDDARCSTNTGRLVLPAGTNGVSLGAQAVLSGATQLTILVQYTPQSLNAARYLVTHASGATSAATSFGLRTTSAGLLEWVGWNGAALDTYTRAGALTAGSEYIAGAVYDGTLATVADRVKLFATAGASGVFGATTLSSVGGASTPAALSATASVAAIGSLATGTNAIAAPVDTVALYIGTALTAAQIDAEIASGFATAHHRYTFDGSLADSGTVGGWPGTILGTGSAYCSDDRRWPTAVCGSSSAAFAYNAGTGRMTSDAFDDYVRIVGGSLSTITGDCTLVLVGVEPTVTGTLAELSVGSTSRVLRVAALGTTIDSDVVASAPIPLASGVRALVHRRVGLAGAGVLGARDGSATEVTAADSSLTTLSPDTLTIGGTRATTPAGQNDLSLIGFLLLRTGATAAADFAIRYAADVLGATV